MHLTYKVLAAILFANGLLTGYASAAIEAKLPVPKIYSISAGVVLGVIEKVTPETGAISVNATETIAGTGFSGPFRIAVKAPGILKNLKVGQPVLVMPSKVPNATQVMLHLGDAWALGDIQAGAKLPFYVVSGMHEEFNHTYPGRTAAVVEIMREMKKSGKVDLLDKVDPQIFAGGIKQLGKLPMQGARQIIGTNFGDDKKPALAVATEEGVKVFVYDGKAFVASTVAAPADFPVRGKPMKPAVPLLATAYGDFAENGAAAIFVYAEYVRREGIQLTDKVPDDDFKRLTGDPISVYPLGFDKGVKFAAATAIDVNGDGKKDVVILTEENGIVMVNRGYGAFFVIANLKKMIAGEDKPLPFKIGPGLLLAAADVDGDKREDLIILEADGTVWAVMNPVVGK